MARFVVQKHLASQLHYDFRLEVGGVLWSWALPEGPSLDPAAKRLAVQREDHPLDYADFEGMIEGGDPGAGPVIVWDTGEYEVLESRGTRDVEHAFARGKVDLFLDGKRLRGRFSLIRMRRRPRQWLLVKVRDAWAQPGGDVVEEFEDSVLTGRTVEDVRAGR